MVDIDLSKYKILLNQSYEKKLGKVAKVVGLTVESIGPAAKLNDLCHIITQDKDQVINAEVVGFRDDRVLLMPYDQTVGVGLGSRVENTGAPLKVMVGDELLGKVLDGLGNPIDGSEIHWLFCTGAAAGSFDKRAHRYGASSGGKGSGWPDHRGKRTENWHFCRKWCW